MVVLHHLLQLQGEVVKHLVNVVEGLGPTFLYPIHTQRMELYQKQVVV